jgi:hypothetical protein
MIEIIGLAIGIAVLAVLVSAGVGGLWLVVLGWVVDGERPRGGRRRGRP